mmetsp:Transcript_98552/g.234717  ORF Transcript_98552/g.234717 Transcript_98552/m.234717 type:complete len:285 (-) Transcript_98552:153-1007(-)
METVDLYVADRPYLHHEVVCSMLNELIIPEDQLLLSLGTRAPVVAAVAGDHRPLTLLHHEVHQLHRPLAHVVLPLGTAALECGSAELQVAIVGIRLQLFRFPLGGEESVQLLEDVLGVGPIDFDVADLTELDHDQRGYEVQRVRGLELHLLLSDLTFPAQVARIADLQRPTTLVRHELCQLHRQLPHVVLPLCATSLVCGVAGYLAILPHFPQGPGAVAQAVVVLHLPNAVRIVVTAAAARLIVAGFQEQANLRFRSTPVLRQPVIEPLVDATRVLALHLHEAE